MIVPWCASPSQVYVAGVLDREKQAEYTLAVTATDGKFTANTTVTVTVIDVNGWWRGSFASSNG